MAPPITRTDTLDAGPPLTDEQWALVLSCMPKLPREALARWGVGLRGLIRDELHQAAVDGLIHAAQKYDPTKGASFPTYAKLWVHQKCQVWHRVAKRRMSKETPMTSLFKDEEHAGMLTDGPVAAVSREPDPSSAGPARADAARLLALLPPRWAQALWLVCGQGYLLREAGEVMGVDKERVRQLVAKAREWLAKYFDGVRCE